MESFDKNFNRFGIVAVVMTVVSGLTSLAVAATVIYLLLRNFG
jgi:hypothetical protein